MANNAVNEFNQQVKPVSLWADAWKRLRKNKMALAGLWVVAIYILVSLFAPYLPFYDYAEQNLAHVNLPPSLKPAGQVAMARLEARMAVVKKSFDEGRTDLQSELDMIAAEMASLQADIASNPAHSRVYLLGTDYLGRDMFARVIYGGRISIMIGLVGTITAVFVGIIIGSIAGYAGGRLDNFLMRFVDIMYGLPYMLIVIILMALGAKAVWYIALLLGTVTALIGSWYLAKPIRTHRKSAALAALSYFLFVIVLGALSYAAYLIGGSINEMYQAEASAGSQSSIVILFIAIALVSWLTIARVVRGQIISLKNSEFVEAARSMGAGTGRIIFRHLLPNTLGVIIIFSTLQMPSFIMNESFLSFLGLGVSAPDASWGTLVSEGVQGMELYPWRLYVPAIAMTIFLFAMNFLGDGLRDALDPQSKNRT